MPTTADFGTVKMGVQSPEQSITVRNSGATPIGPLSIMIGDATEFRQTFGSCQGTTLAPGATCTVALAFNPTQAGQRQTSIVVQGGSAQVSVTAQGQAMGGPDGGVTSPNAALVPSQPTFDFPRVTQANPNDSAQIFTILNQGAQATGQVTVASSDATHFHVDSTTCKGPLEPASGTCALVVSFRPSSPYVAQYSSKITVTANPGGTATIAVTGTADQAVVGQALFAVDQSSKQFPATLVNSNNPPSVTITLHNVGDAPSGVPHLSTVNPAFSINNGCYNVLSQKGAAGDSCQIAIQFRPTAAQAYADVLTISNQGGGSNTSVNIKLTGTGYNQSSGGGTTGGGTSTTATGTANWGTLEGSGYSFVTVPAPGETVEIGPYTLTNTSATDSMVVPDTFVYGSPYPANSGDMFNLDSTDGTCGYTYALAPGQACTYYITFAPTAAGTYGARIYAGANNDSIYAIGTSQ